MTSMKALHHLLCFVALFSVASLVAGSSGDRSPAFQDCITTCQTFRCHGAYEQSMPLSLRLTRWSCLDDCKYTCMHEITERDVSNGRPVQQYYGKWPFWRWAGMQEPASVIFSVFNLWAHFVGYMKVKRKLPDSHPMKQFYILWAFCSMNAWFWSAVFHTRDLPITEKLDYFSAALAILNALYYTIIRIFQIVPFHGRASMASGVEPMSVQLQRILGSICGLIYLAHTYYLTHGPGFDYTYNTIFNLVIGLAHNLLWTLYALPSSLSYLSSRFPNRPKTYRPSFVTKAGLFVALTTIATSLELFDFPPWKGHVDAHALWHAATSPIAYFWYNFLIEDSLDPSWRDLWQRT